MSADELYQLEATPPAPALPGVVILRRSADEAIDAAAAEMMLHAQNCVRQFGDFHIALSGGSTPIPLYERLMIDPGLRAFPWDQTHVWIVDERRVPFDDQRSNFRAVNEILGDHAGLPSGHLHPIFAMSDDADSAYEIELRKHLGKREPGHERLDYVLLGMGADAHTASLFPHSPALEFGLRPPRLVRMNSGPTVTPPDRVTMTFDLINASRFVAILATGSGKKATIARVATAWNRGAGVTQTPGRPIWASAADPAQVAEFPVLGVRPTAGVLRWYIDHDACPAAPAAEAAAT